MTFASLLRREQATRDAQARRIESLENQILARPALAPAKSVRWKRTPKTNARPPPKRAAELRPPSRTRKKLKRKNV
jgi:hypothetical protein